MVSDFDHQAAKQHPGVGFLVRAASENRLHPDTDQVCYRSVDFFQRQSLKAKSLLLDAGVQRDRWNLPVSAASLAAGTPGFAGFLCFNCV